MTHEHEKQDMPNEIYAGLTPDGEAIWYKSPDLGKLVDGVRYIRPQGTAAGEAFEEFLECVSNQMKNRYAYEIGVVKAALTSTQPDIGALIEKATDDAAIIQIHREYALSGEKLYVVRYQTLDEEVTCVAETLAEAIRNALTQTEGK